MADGPGVAVDLVVVSALHVLVAKEVDGLVLDAALLLGLGLEVIEAVGLVPALGEDVERNLATNGEAVVRVRKRFGQSALYPYFSLCIRLHLFQGPTKKKGSNYSRQTKVGKLLLERLDKLDADLVHLVVGVEVLALLRRGVPADGRDVDHAVAELEEGTTLDGDLEVGDVVQDEAHELLVAVLADPGDEAGRRQRLAALESRQPVLREAVVKQLLDRHVGRAELLLLLA